jgi:transcriptional regulator with XRE-family HTH domain
MEKSELNAHIGRRLRAERRRRDLTQKEMAHICGVSFQQIHKYEQGLAAVSAGMLWTLAEALSIGVSDLFPRQEIPTRLAQAAPTGA